MKEFFFKYGCQLSSITQDHLESGVKYVRRG